MIVRLRALPPALALLAAGVVLPAHAQETEVQWQSVSSGSGDLSAGQAFDLDTGDLARGKPEFQLERGSDGLYWAPYRIRPGIGCGATLAPGDFTTFDIAKSESLTVSLEPFYLCGGSAPPLPAGATVFVTTCDGNVSKVSIDECGATLKFRYATYRKQTVLKAPVPGAPTVPPLKSPPDGVTFDHETHDLLLAWGALPGAATYDLELDCKGCCGPRKELFCGEQENGKVFRSLPGLKTSAYYTVWNGPYQGRWRVRALKADGLAGPWSAWSKFTFSK